MASRARGLVLMDRAIFFFLLKLLLGFSNFFPGISTTSSRLLLLRVCLLLSLKHLLSLSFSFFGLLLFLFSFNGLLLGFLFFKFLFLFSLLLVELLFLLSPNLLPLGLLLLVLHPVHISSFTCKSANVGTHKDHSSSNDNKKWLKSLMMCQGLRSQSL